MKAVQNLLFVVNKMYHSYLLSYLGETLYYSQKYDQALKELTRAINLQK